MVFSHHVTFAGPLRYEYPQKWLYFGNYTHQEVNPSKNLSRVVASILTPEVFPRYLHKTIFSSIIYLFSSTFVIFTNGFRKTAPHNLLCNLSRVQKYPICGRKLLFGHMERLRREGAPFGFFGAQMLLEWFMAAMSYFRAPGAPVQWKPTRSDPILPMGHSTCWDSGTLWFQCFLR